MNSATSDGSHPLVRRLLKNTAAFALAGLIAQTASVLTEVMIARRLGQVSYGIFTSAFVLTSIMMFVIDMGTQFKLVEDGSSDRARIPMLLGTTLVFKCTMFVLFYPLVIVGATLAGFDGATLAFITIFFFYGLVMLLHETLSSVYGASQKIHISALFQGLNAVLILLVVATGLELMAELETVAVGYIGTGLIVGLAWVWLCFRSYRPRVELNELPAILAGSWLYSVHGLLMQLFQRLDVLLLALLRPMTEVGLYAAGYKLLDLGFKLPIMAMRVIAPALFEQRIHDRPAYALTNGVMLRVATAGGLMVSLVLFLNAERIIELIFGSQYRGAIPILRVVSATFAIKFMYIGLETTLTTSGHHTRRTASVALTTVLAMIGYILLIARYGAMGAAVGRLVWDLTLFTMLAWTVRDEVNTLRIMVLPSMVAMAMAAAVWFTGLDPMLQTMVALAGFGSSLLWIGYVQKEEYRYLMLALKRGDVATRQSGGIP